MVAGYLTHFKLKEPKLQFCDVVPELTEDESSALEENVKAVGVQVPIEVDEAGNILDGRHRQRFEPDCPYRIVTQWKTDAEKRAHAYLVNTKTRSWPAAKRRKAEDAMKATALQLRTEGHTQKQAADLLGIAQPRISEWESEAKAVPNPSNIGSDNTRNVPDCRRKLTPEQEQEITALAASGETHTAIAETYGISSQRVDQLSNKASQSSGAENVQPKAEKPKAPRVSKNATISERAIAAKQAVSDGMKREQAAIQFRLGNGKLHDYKRAVQVATSGNVPLVESMDTGVLAVREAQQLVGKPEATIQKAIEDARLKQAQKNHRALASKGKPVSELLRELLERTWVDWRGCKLAINSRTLPSDGDKRSDIVRLCKEVRFAVTNILDKIEKELG